MYKNLFGLPDSFNIKYINEYGWPAEINIPVFRPAPDSLDKADSLKPEKYTPKERRNASSLFIKRYTGRYDLKICLYVGEYLCSGVIV